MTRGTLLGLVNLSLLAGLVLAASDSFAQVSPTSGDGGGQAGPTLSTTECGHGQVTVCGSEPVAQHCTYVFGATASKGAFGFNFGGWQCTGGGTQNRYKDFDPNRSSGTCYNVPRPPADATRTGGRDDESEPSGDSESC